jgi:two-component system, NarL family, nitrate/nitrite response regulator NarL
MALAKDAVVSIGLDRLLHELIKAVLAEYGWGVIEPKSLGADEEASIVLLAAAGSVETIINAVRFVRVQFPAGRIVLLGAEGASADIVRFIEEGVSAYCSTRDGLSDFVNLLQMVRNNRVSCSGHVTQLVLSAIRKRSGKSPAVQDRLTMREEEVLRLIRDGFGNKEIASRLCISPNTVKNHVHHLLEKLKVRSRHEAAWMRQTSRSVGILPRVMNGR